MAIEIKMPALSPTMEEGTLAKWLVKEGDTIRAGDLIAEIETDKATMEYESADEGVVAQILVGEGTDEVKVGTVIALIALDGEASVRSDSVAPLPVSAETPAPVLAGAVAEMADELALIDAAPARKASPLARRLAAAKGIDLSTVAGSGAGGRIVRRDLGIDLPAVAAPAPAIVASPPAAILPPPDVPHDTIKLSTMRKTIARRLSEAKQTVPHFYLAVDCRLDALLALRAQLNATLEGDARLSVNDMLVKALALALADVPEANVQFAGDELYQFQRVDISMAVAIDGGLVTPVITDAANLRLSAIAARSKALAAKARDGKLQPHEYQGGTASLSNLGMFGIRQIIPVINPPQAVILGVGAGEQRPHVIDGAVGIATMLTATGSFDHRAIDGAVGARLMAAFRALVEEPLRMIA
ncbi:MAG: pyruvate dehydrogenase complex dihydrolipoamide acetyltransferase [Sphingomonadales bacterium]|nr:pyruvate dehydrogenase complex dihydrolipoamide acetyltransferase [Sphingomonadales bacterium]